MTLPETIDRAWITRREPLAPNEHVVPFAEVTADRLFRGLLAVWDERQRNEPLRYQLPDGTLYMHPGDRINLLATLPVEGMWARVPAPITPAGNVSLIGGSYLLVTHFDPAVVRRGRPRLALDDGTEVLL